MNEALHSMISLTEKARSYWRARLSGETRIQGSQHPRCRFAIVVPVMDERIERIDRQLDSFFSQEQVTADEFEIIYVVNNDLDDGSERHAHIVETNAAVLKSIRKRKEANVHAIDKSTRGNEITGCNVGRARNRGVAEASLRFHENENNGILVQTDADTYAEDKTYLARVRDILDGDDKTIGIAGGLIIEFSPDSTDPRELAALERRLYYVSLLVRWNMLVPGLRDPTGAMLSADRFSGAHMISRSLETAAVGGLTDVVWKEDLQLGRDLSAFAESRGQRVIGMRDELFLITALRESRRTKSSLGDWLDKVPDDTIPTVPDPFVDETPHDLVGRICSALRRARNDGRAIRRAFSRKDGTPIISETAVEELMDHVRGAGVPMPEDDFFRVWGVKNLGTADVAQALHARHYPPLAVTDDNLRMLERRISQTPSGRDHVDHVNLILGRFRFPCRETNRQTKLTSE